MIKQAILIGVLMSLFIIGFSGKVVAATSSSSAIFTSSVEYSLPYPGILPDHPLYALKNIRDWIFERLITDPMRKTEFYILQSDKRLAMAVVFMDKTKMDEAKLVVADEEQFMRKALETAKSIKAAGQEIPGYLKDRLARSIVKHIELLNGFIVQSDESHRASFQGSLEMFRALQQESVGLK